jgi:hypothetical protein
VVHVYGALQDCGPIQPMPPHWPHSDCPPVPPLDGVVVVVGAGVVVGDEPALVVTCTVDVAKVDELDGGGGGGGEPLDGAGKRVSLMSPNHCMSQLPLIGT